MQYAVTYTKDFRHYDEIDEVLLNEYSGSDYLIEFITSFAEGGNLTFIIDLTKVEDIEGVIPYLNKLIKDGYSIKVKIDIGHIAIKEIINDLKENNISFMFKQFATTTEEIYIQAGMGASDIYIVQELGFYLKRLKRIKENFNIKFRVFPNITQVAAGGKDLIPAMKRFWIRPEDVELYEDYIDVLEIWGTKRLSTIYEIYKQGQWLGNLNDIILDFDETIIPNTGLNPHFAEMRIDCHKKCLFNQCNLCLQMADLATNFNKVGIEVIKPRKKPKVLKEREEQIKEQLGIKE